MPRAPIPQAVQRQVHPLPSSENYIISNDCSLEVAQLRTELNDEIVVRQKQDERIAKALARIEACATDLSRIREYHEGVTQRSEKLEAAVQNQHDLANRVAENERQLNEGMSATMAEVDAFFGKHATQVAARLEELEQRLVKQAELTASQYAQKVTEQLTHERTEVIENLTKTQEQRFLEAEGERRRLLSTMTGVSRTLEQVKADASQNDSALKALQQVVTSVESSMQEQWHLLSKLETDFQSIQVSRRALHESTTNATIMLEASKQKSSLEDAGLQQRRATAISEALEAMHRNLEILGQESLAASVVPPDVRASSAINQGTYDVPVTVMQPSRPPPPQAQRQQQQQQPYQQAEQQQVIQHQMQQAQFQPAPPQPMQPMQQQVPPVQHSRLVGPRSRSPSPQDAAYARHQLVAASRPNTPTRATASPVQTQRVTTSPRQAPSFAVASPRQTPRGIGPRTPPTPQDVQMRQPQAPVGTMLQVIKGAVPVPGVSNVMHSPRLV
eukprot:gnl/MRDRNA2_/MRDRNA2_65361_c0_seq1.p1 gnl/MRDRNA2_/MRDRNA2_65361_c0~~gnl/MRDRNA2_/MRDRNA2_65361_c0_seq1.p1  ORF type:complete len:585 (+),score=120.31 gnl/MRDRNA2_/MRDRNA2_65361_c0_seq1:253-1755(+)